MEEFTFEVDKIEVNKESCKTFNPTFFYNGIKYTSVPSEVLEYFQAVMDDETHCTLRAKRTF